MLKSDFDSILKRKTAFNKTRFVFFFFFFFLQAGFIPPKSSGTQVLDGGSSDAHVITFAQTYMT